MRKDFKIFSEDGHFSNITNTQLTHASFTCFHWIRVRDAKYVGVKPKLIKYKSQKPKIKIRKLRRNCDLDMKLTGF